MKKTNGRNFLSVCAKQIPQNGFTLIELLVVIAIIAILASILMPALSQSRERSRHVSCASNQKSIAAAFQQYADDYNGCLPRSYSMNHPNRLRWVPTKETPDTHNECGARLLCHKGYLPGNPSDSQKWHAYKILNCPSLISKGQTTSYFWFTGYPDSIWLSSITKLPPDRSKFEVYLFGDVAGLEISWIDDKVHDVIQNHPMGSNWARYDGSVINLREGELFNINRNNGKFSVPFEIRYGKDAKGMATGLATLK
jgi:prepilin-type N-terminal cleavage/methylation domain-containing protein